MKSKVIGLHVLLLLSIGAAIALSLTGSHFFTIGFFVMTAIVALALILLTWMKFLKKTLLAYESLTGGKNAGKISLWNFSNVHRIEKNHNLVLEKFKASAELIANLSNPDASHHLEHLVAEDPIGQALKKIKDELKVLKQEEGIG